MLKLSYSATSPYVRKVRVCALELGLHEQIALEPVTVLPTEINENYLRSGNPLGKIPALMLPDGTIIHDSLIICQYLDSQQPAHTLIPDNAQRWHILTQHQLATGINDALILMRYESWLRPEERRWDLWYQGQLQKVEHGLHWFEQHPDMLQSSLNLAQIALGCALGYLDFRFKESTWQQRYPAVASWYQTFSQRPAMRETAPH